MGLGVVPPAKLLGVEEEEEEDHEIFTRYQSPWGDAKSAKKFEISHLVCKLWVCKVQKRSNSSFLEMYLLGVVT